MFGRSSSITVQMSKLGRIVLFSIHLHHVWYIYSYLTQSPSPPPLTTKPATKQQLINNSDKKSGDKLETLDMIQFIGLI